MKEQRRCPDSRSAFDWAGGYDPFFFATTTFPPRAVIMSTPRLSRKVLMQRRLYRPLGTPWFWMAR